MSEPFGLLAVLKPPGMTAHDVVSVVRRVVGTRRVGHGGTLDPAAAGVTLVAVGKATRLLGYVQDDKAYRAEVVFGLATDTGDFEGRVLARASAEGLTEASLGAALAAFRGRIVQRPPMASAVHVGGKRLYELARAGVVLAEAEIPTREVSIHHLEAQTFTAGPLAATQLDVSCSAGTYIRSLAVDLGQALGLPACLRFLLRTRSGPLGLAEAQTLEELAGQPRWLPLERWLGHLPRHEATAEEVSDLRLGRRIPGMLEARGRVHGPDGALVAIAESRDGQLQPVLVI
ncbi:MAG: tRNA pseudouridine(55) synthase TruB [Candidatus Sericytochromatia bacterium]|nr:tRNA pseudouridine(55) synthase TruB [Candidatus Sericytochromatia bacterium]